MKKPLALSRVVLVCLPGELLAVESKQRASLGCKVSVIVGRDVSSRPRLCGTQRDVAIGAHPARCMQVNPTALPALKEDRSGTRETESLSDEDVLGKHARTGQVAQHVRRK